MARLSHEGLLRSGFPLEFDPTLSIGAQGPQSATLNLQRKPMGSGDLTSLIPGAGRNRPGEEKVDAKEFDLTQLAKQLALAIPIVMGGILGALELLGVKDVFEEPAYVVTALGVTAAGVIGLSIVSAADIVARAYVAAHQPSPPAPPQTPEDPPEEREDRLEHERLKRFDRLEKERLDRADELEKERVDRERSRR